MVKPISRSQPKNSQLSFPSTNGGVILDIGTGDGRFVYQMARKNPDRLYIGIDASSEALVKISEKVHRNPKHGGAQNAIFLQARVEALPEELHNTADEVHIHFPWGSLLRAVLLPDEIVLASLRRVCKQGALMEIITSIEPGRDSNQLKRLGINNELVEKDFDRYVKDFLVCQFHKAGLRVAEHGPIPPLNWPALCTAWSAKLKSSNTRTVHYLIAEAQ